MQEAQTTISIEECRKYLGEDGKLMSDKQIGELRDALSVLVDSVLDDGFLPNKLVK